MKTMNYIKGYGYLQYDPFRGEMKHRTNWWCVLTLDKEITRYYRWWMSFQYHIHLQQPSWDAHISVVRGEKPRPEFVQHWKKYQGEKIEFEYQHGIIHHDKSQRTDDRAANNVGGLYYFMNVRCPRLEEIRAELGLRTGFNYHVTIGRTYDYIPRKRGR